MTRHIIIAISLLLLISCKKIIEIREVQVDKKYSWTEIKKFSGTEKLFLSSGSSSNAIFLQQPFFFTELRNQNINTGITIYGASLPTDIDIRMPINKDFSAFPFSDSVLRIVNNLYPIVSPSGGYFDLKKIDPTLTNIQKSYLLLFKCMAINKNGTLLLAYNNNRAGFPFTFMMLKIKTNSIYPYIDTIFTKTITIPRTSISYVRHISSINDYYLVDISGEGIFKIYEDGTFNKVFNTAIVDAFFEWDGKVYALVEWNRVLISSNNGDNWQEYSGTNSIMTLSNYYVIKDSLIGANRDNLFTLTWSGTNYTQRFLKVDGVENSRINGIEVLRDSVYIATTSGLFVKPLSTFFDSK